MPEAILVTESGGMLHRRFRLRAQIFHRKGHYVLLMPQSIHMVLLCFILLSLAYSSLGIYIIYLFTSRNHIYFNNTRAIMLYSYYIHIGICIYSDEQETTHNLDVLYFLS